MVFANHKFARGLLWTAKEKTNLERRLVWVVLPFLAREGGREGGFPLRNFELVCTSRHLLLYLAKCVSLPCAEMLSKRLHFP